MRLTEVSALWGNMYRRRYYLNGRRVAESHASYILKNHADEIESTTSGAGKFRKDWNIGPRFDAPAMIDHPDCI